MEKFSINNILKISQLVNELEFEKASSLYLRLRGKGNDSKRNHLKELIKNYELKFWSDELEINDAQIKENDEAERLVQSENSFIASRRELIKKKLTVYGIMQSDLATILGHRKGYMSELINGLRPFSKEDLVILSRLLGLKLEVLVPPFIKKEKAEKINETIKIISKKRKVHIGEKLKLQMG